MQFDKEILMALVFVHCFKEYNKMNCHDSELREYFIREKNKNLFHLDDLHTLTNRTATFDPFTL